MSPSVGNFVHDLVEMAKAMEQLPVLEQEIAKAKAELDQALRDVQAREEAIVRYKDEINGLQSKNRDLEVARDDAEYRFLELDEKAHQVLSQVSSITAAANAVKVMLDPPKPEPIPEPVVEIPTVSQEPVQAVNWTHPDTPMPLPGQSDPFPHVDIPTTSSAEAGVGDATSVANPSGQSETPPTQAQEPQTGTGTENVASSSEPVGQSDHPFSPPNPTTIPEPISNSNVTSLDVGSVQSSPEPEARWPDIFKGRRYRDIPGYVSHDDWVRGGGTSEDYYS